MESERQFRELQVCYNFKVSNYELRFNGSFSQTYARHIVAKLEDYTERDKIRDAELALMKEKLDQGAVRGGGRRRAEAKRTPN